MTTGEITLYIAASVDGYIATPDGGVAWLDEFEDDTEAESGYDAFFADVDCLVMGGTTYEQVQGFGEWPYGEKPTYVVTSRERERATDAVELVDGDVGDLAERVRRRYAHIWLVGGATLAQAFLRQHEVDHLRLSLIPVLLGEGIRLFEETETRVTLEHVETTTHDSGIVEVAYAVA